MCEQAQCTVDVIGISHDFVTLCAMSKHYPLLYKLKEYKKDIFHYDLDILNNIENKEYRHFACTCTQCDKIHQKRCYIKGESVLGCE